MTTTIRGARPEDEAAWRALWQGYTTFYGSDIPEPVTRYTWQRALDPASPLGIRLAVCNEQIAGFSLYVTHEGSWVTTPVCYLEDLFVDPAVRGQGLGRALIDDLIHQALQNNWSRLYWHTREGNPARKLYDQFTQADDYVRYQLAMPANS
ncbi:GNAT family N-acetyltransferase [Mangrovibacter plantisponsor]|uniref:Ribosomal protein S18 acetylase RimI-like enzyme n=1 Tax=Mangrovibacter plantisponsor TaxID=451513 RepID=A0A317PQJ3_9ENTR|nr:GNAT family N-acetyltransferase [Mangrovibacter plantisponsor]PWW03000.1 ribosomal protein S18 acetylase RimI-like enzyme [Mangrovibacter plantisponsor]